MRRITLLAGSILVLCAAGCSVGKSLGIGPWPIPPYTAPVSELTLTDSEKLLVKSLDAEQSALLAKVHVKFAEYKASDKELRAKEKAYIEKAIKHNRDQYKQMDMSSAAQRGAINADLQAMGYPEGHDVYKLVGE